MITVIANESLDLSADSLTIHRVEIQYIPSKLEGRWKTGPGLPDVTGSLTDKFALWLLSWYCMFAIWIRINIQDSVILPALLPIDIEDAHHYWNVVYG